MPVRPSDFSLSRDVASEHRFKLLRDLILHYGFKTEAEIFQDFELTEKAVCTKMAEEEHLIKVNAGFVYWIVDSMIVDRYFPTNDYILEKIAADVPSDYRDIKAAPWSPGVYSMAANLRRVPRVEGPEAEASEGSAPATSAKEVPAASKSKSDVKNDKPASPTAAELEAMRQAVVKLKALEAMQKEDMETQIDSIWGLKIDSQAKLSILAIWAKAYMGDKSRPMSVGEAQSFVRTHIASKQDVSIQDNQILHAHMDRMVTED